MASILEMAEAHLLNVQRELQNLSQKRSEIDKEIETLNGYLVEGAKVVQENTPTTEDTESPESSED